MEESIKIILCRNWGHFKAAFQMKGDWEGVWLPFLLHAACRTDCPLPSSSPWRRTSCPGACPALRGVQHPAGKGVMPAGSDSRVDCILASRCESRSGISSLTWLSHSSSFHWKSIMYESDFCIAGENIKAFSPDGRITGEQGGDLWWDSKWLTCECCTFKLKSFQMNQWNLPPFSPSPLPVQICTIWSTRVTWSGAFSHYPPRN